MDWKINNWQILSAILVLVFLLIPVFCFAAPFLTCDPQPKVDEYNIFINGNKVTTSEALLDIESGLYYLYLDMATLNLVDGSYIATATAENEGWESALSNECPFTKAVPAPPQNLRRVSSE